MIDIDEWNAMHLREMYCGSDDWELWAGRVERCLGHSLDGDQSENGYSLDDAYDAYRLGVTANAHAHAIKGSARLSASWGRMT